MKKEKNFQVSRKDDKETQNPRHVGGGGGGRKKNKITIASGKTQRRDPHRLRKLLDVCCFCFGRGCCPGKQTQTYHRD